ncbi:Rtt106 domain-containing protein [Mycena kentingensis (nom. inval.)]|nr:Rtt106 domain-containing protein [Mycena kentingensis (nom. inval.)]
MPPTSHFLQYFPLVIDTFTYGIYCSLFVQSVLILLARRRRYYKIHLACLSTLFLLSTMHILAAYTWAFITDQATEGIYEVLSLRTKQPNLYGPDDPMMVHYMVRLLRTRYALANALADAILIHRCYVIWGNSWRVVVVPILAYFAGIVGMIVGALPVLGRSERTAIAVCIGTTFFTNILASLLAAGRIWWISRRASMILPARSRRMYSNLTAILLESGLIYPISIIIAIVLFLVPQTSTISVLISIAPIYHIVAIAPTLIIVRVGMGVSTDDVDQTLTSLGGVQEMETRRACGPPRSSLRFCVPAETDMVATVELGLSRSLEASVGAIGSESSRAENKDKPLDTLGTTM